MVALWDALVLTLVRVTVAPGIAAPVGSVTAPVTSFCLSGALCGLTGVVLVMDVQVLNSGSRLQNVRDTDTNSCGRWVGLRLCFHQKGVSLGDFQSCFGGGPGGSASRGGMTPDKWAAALTAFVR